jgi:hypothetical protein
MIARRVASAYSARRDMVASCSIPTRLALC